MRLLLLVFLLSISINTFAQFANGFDKQEVKSLIALCNSYTFEDLYQSDSRILPKDYSKVFTSEVIGMDNRFQVYEKNKVGVINFRGSTDKMSSWVENIYSAMIPAIGTIQLNELDIPYRFATDSSANVHSGYALAVLTMSPTILEQIKLLNNKGIYHILITGHSQGGALANLTRAYLEHLPAGLLSSQNSYKTYAFANPMVGNKEFATEYNQLFSENQTSFSIINTEDVVPYMPMHYQEEGKVFTIKRFQNWFSGEEEFSFASLGKDLFLRKFERGVTSYINGSNKLIEKGVSTAYGSIDMPEYSRDINYYQVGNVIELAPFVYPNIVRPTSDLSEKELEKLALDANAKFYKKEPNYYQHKPYNYYVGILKVYFPGEYKNLSIKYLPENL